MNTLTARIQKIQDKLRVPATGRYDLVTINALERLLELRPYSTILDTLAFKRIQVKLEFTGTDVDGILGNLSTNRIEALLFSQKAPIIPPHASLMVSLAALDLIVTSEISSKQAYLDAYQYPIWPGGASGITIGIGFDLGHTTWKAFQELWAPYLHAETLQKFKNAIGKTGTSAQQALNSTIKKIAIPWDAAIDVFYNASMPVYAKLTRATYPGIELLPPDAQGAILSLIYNRGSKLTGSTRTEMLHLKTLIAQKNLTQMAAEIRNMKRLWPNMKGLRIRRDKEADLIANSTYVFNELYCKYV